MIISQTRPFEKPFIDLRYITLGIFVNCQMIKFPMIMKCELIFFYFAPGTVPSIWNYWLVVIITHKVRTSELQPFTWYFLLRHSGQISLRRSQVNLLHRRWLTLLLYNFHVETSNKCVKAQIFFLINLKSRQGFDLYFRYFVGFKKVSWCLTHFVEN